MSNYEFWDDLGKIFNAVVAYQEKSMEFDKRFINPWIRLGNVFDKQDRSTETVNAYKKAIELDPKNAQNWYELGNAYFRTEAYEDAADAYNKAIGLESDSGWAYNNLAFTLVKQGKYAEAIPLYQRSIDLLQDDRDKAVAWNRLANVYRKLNKYESALDAFQKADELDDVPDGPTLIEGNNGDTSSEATDAMASFSQPSVPGSLMKDAVPANDLEETIPSAADSTSKTLLVEVPSAPSVSESIDESQFDVLASVAENSQGDTRNSAGDVTGEISAAANLEEEAEIVEETVEPSAQATDDDNVAPAHAAYEEFLKDNGDDLHILVSEAIVVDVEDQDSGASQDPVTKIDPSGEVQIEVDTKNAQAWNEMGNVYFNTYAYDDAIAAYRKAIELDRQFAWPYSNLALTYVQKGRLVEAILFYQRSIELFSSEKDKAVSWNRLGNVYRRLDDYENAILAYQQADELDSDNATLSMQSRFSLLGNYFTDSKPSYVG